MKDIKVPGFLWVVGIAVVVVLIETYVPGQYQYFAEGAIVLVMGFAKAAKLGTDDVDKLVAILKSHPSPATGAIGAERAGAVELVVDTKSLSLVQNKF